MCQPGGIILEMEKERWNHDVCLCLRSGFAWRDGSLLCLSGKRMSTDEFPFREHLLQPSFGL